MFVLYKDVVHGAIIQGSVRRRIREPKGASLRMSPGVLVGDLGSRSDSEASRGHIGMSYGYHESRRNYPRVI